MTGDLVDHEYLGDSVYASFDGFQVWLHLNSHHAPPVVALEPKVIEALNMYWAAIQRKYPPEHGL
jgi:hypothetical protein